MTLLRERRGAVEWLTLDRPATGNAFDPPLFRALSAALAELARDESLRALVLAGAGKHFCSGADVRWMRSGVSSAETAELAAMFAALAEFPAPTVARVQGGCLGGGMGLVAACDFAVAAEDAVFGFTEVRLGIAPAVISPYAVARLGLAVTREFFLTGERFSAARAREMGMVRHVVAPKALDQAVEALLAELRAAAPGAQRAIKRLLRGPADEAGTVALLDEMRAGAEAQEGLSAFLEKRPPAWREEP